MKRILLMLLLGLFLLSSCVAPDKNETTVYEETSLMRADSPNDWEYILKDTTGTYYVEYFVNGIRKIRAVQDTTWQKQVKIPKSTFIVQMSRTMVKKLITLAGYFSADLKIGIFLMILLFGSVIWFLMKNGWTVDKLSFGAAALFILALGFSIRTIQKKPSELSENNKKRLTRTEYETIIKTDPNLDSFWMSKWKQNELVGLYNKNAE